MKIIRTTFRAILVLIALIIVTLLGIIGLDSIQTSYLNPKKITGAEINSFIIKNVNVIPMTTDTVYMNTNVTIINGAIKSIGNTPEPNSFPVIDGHGGYLSPGLIDMHVHVWDDYELGLYLANGVTAVRNLWGQPMHLRMKERVAEGKIISPMFFTSSPKLTGPDYPGDDNLQLNSVAQAKQKITDYKNRGYDFVKTYNGLTKELYTAILEQCAIEQLDVVAHPSDLVPYDFHFKPQIKTIEHTEDIVQQPLAYQLDTAKLNEVMQLYANHKQTALCPTLVVYYNIYRLLTEEGILENKEMAFINPVIKSVDSDAQFNRWQYTLAQEPDIAKRIKKQHDFHLYIIKKLHENGALLVCGTDAGIGITPAGISIHQELAFYKQAGLSNYEVLKTATINPSKTHDFLANMGTIEAGKFANLVLTSANPLEDLSTLKSPEMVICQGRMLNKETLKAFEDNAKDRSNFLVSLLRYVEFLVVER